MANLHDCLLRAVEGGELDQARADEAISEFDQLVERYSQAMPIHQAEATAALHLKEATRRAQRSRRHMVLNQLQSMVRIRHLVEISPDPARAVLAFIEARGDDGFKGESIQFIAQSLQARVRNDLQEFLRDTGLNVVGNSRDIVKLKDVLREAHGQSTGNPVAKQYADAIARVQDWQRKMFNAHGGDIGKIEGYGVRHSHDARAIEAAGFDAWFGDIFDRLDWSRIINRQTDKPFAEAGAKPAADAVRPMLREIYDNITTNGWINREPSLAVGGRALYNQRAEPRILHFKDADAWMGYNDAYGSSDLFTSIVGTMDAMARDIAHMRVLGPNPTLGLEYAVQVATKKAELAGDAKLSSAVRKSASRAKALLAHSTGAVNVAEDEGMARFFSAVRHVNVATKLGSAILSSVTDLQTAAAGALAMGMRPRNMFATAVRAIASKATRDEAARMGFVAETLMDMMSSSARLTNDVIANDTFSRMSNFTIRASGLSHWTDSMRLAVQMETAGHLAGQTDKGLRNVDPMLRQLLERNGITEADWGHLRHKDGLFTARNGSTFLSPFWWLENQTTLSRPEAEGLAIRLQAAIQDQVETFVPSRRLRASAWWMHENKPGTWSGELLRSSAGFKNYAMSLTIGQIALWNTLPSRSARVRYLASMALGTTLTGALALQLKELAKGNDPRPMAGDKGLKFWGAAIAQGGGLGIFGDFLFSETNRFGGGVAETIAGPVVGTVSDFANVPISNTAAFLRGENPHLGRDVSNLVRFNTPVASSLWYARAGWGRLVADNLQSLLDPEAEQTWRNQVRKQQRERGTQPWWEPGSLVPDRGPDISNIVGDGR
jgi:hypothetical protein